MKYNHFNRKKKFNHRKTVFECKKNEYFRLKKLHLNFFFFFTVDPVFFNIVLNSFQHK